MVDNPKRRLEDWLPEDVELAVQPSPNGTGGAVAAAGAHIDASATVVVIDGRRAADHRRRRSRQLVEAHEDERRRGHDGHDGARRPGAVRPRRSATSTATSSGRRGQGRRGRRDARAARDPRGQHRHLRVRRRQRCSPRSRQIDSDNAQGELYLPDVLPKLREPGKTIAAHLVTDHTLTLGVNDRVELDAGPQARPAAHQRAARRATA